MTQLTDDCFAFGGTLMTMEEALAIFDQRINPVVSVETVPLTAAGGRILAADLSALVSMPAYDNAAVDGYAVNARDLSETSPTTLPVTARLPAGARAIAPLPPGATARIFTGAALPDGADSVVMQEDVALENGHVTIPPGLTAGANRRRKGEDFHADSTILDRGTRLRPQEIGLAAAAGHDRLPVYCRLKVGVFSTGDELLEPGATPARDKTFDANRFLLQALLHNLGVDVQDFGIIPDRLPETVAALRKASTEVDVLITSGGMSTGEEDHIKAAVTQLGRLHFWRLAIKPGRPLALGQIGDVPIVGLPGNVVAAMVCFLRFARPILFRLAGASDVAPQMFMVESGFSMRKKTGRREWIRAQLTKEPGGRVVALRYPKQGSGILSSMVASDGLVELTEDQTDIAAGDPVPFLPFNEVLY